MPGMVLKNSPALFIGHGSPMNALSINSYTQSLVNYVKSIKRPSAIIVISAHWQTEGTFITGSKNPSQIYDFFGFPDELYEIKYAPPGMPELAHQIASDGMGIQMDHQRGIDHAGWAVVKHMYPEQNMPLLEISLDINKSYLEHFELAKQLVKYRKENILFMGSGNMVHNLGDISYKEDAPPFEWAVKIDQWFEEQIRSFNTNKILNYPTYLPNYRQGIPTDEHFIPLLYTLGMKRPEEKIHTIHASIQNGSVSMRSLECADT